MLRKMKKKFLDTPIFVRLCFIIFIAFFAMLIMTFYNFSVFTTEKETSTFNMVNQTNHQALNRIDDYLKDLINITKIPLTFKQNDTTYLRSLNQFNKTGQASIEFQKMNEQMFEEILTYKKNIDSCFIFSISGAGDYKVRTPVYKVFNPLEQDWFQKSIDSFGKPIIIDTYQMPFVADFKEPVYVFGIARGIVRLENSRVIGVLLVNTRVDYFKDICNNMKITNSHRIILLHDNLTIYDTSEDNISCTADPQIASIPHSLDNRTKLLTIDGVRYFTSSLSSGYSNWRLLSLIPENELFHDLRAMQKSTIILSTLLILVTLVLLFAVSSQIIYPLKKLVALMKLAENGDFNVQININSNDEIGVLASSFNSMTQKIEGLIQEVYLEKITQSKLELQMLQAQINPHFLYNTLESISMMATIHDDDTTSEMASCLGSILRYGISQYNADVTIEEEIKHLKEYIYLQEIRFHSMYSIKIQIDPVFYSYQIIKMILQPIVENAIYHGMDSTRKNGLILITARQEDKKTLNFIIEDNGSGMEEEQLNNLNGYINDENELFSSIGLRNVNKRIRLRYGESYGIIITSRYGEGTRVTVTIPVIK